MSWYRFISYGKVQHVYYRRYVSEQMQQEGFVGYVRNLPDGTVETVVKADKRKDLSRIVSILKEGSPLSVTEHIDYRLYPEANEETIKDFRIRR